MTHSDETKHKISNSMKGKTPSNKGKLKPLQEYTCIVCERSIFDRYRIRVVCSLKCQHSLAGGYRKNSTIKRRTKYKEFQMDSGSELEFAKLLDKYDVKWVKNSTISFPYTDRNGKSRLFYPDFYLEEYDRWVEVKSEFYKSEWFNEQIKSVPNIEVIWHDDIKLPKCILR